MTIKSSGGNPPTNPLSFSEIANEFGTPPNKNLGAYRVSQTFGALSSQPLDSGIPQSNQIKFSDFYSKQLNVIVNFYSGDPESRQNAKTRYNDDNEGNVSVVGGFKSKPSNTSGTHVKIHVNKTIISAEGDNNVALKTGTWNSGTTLRVDVGSSGKILGAGGNGGKGADNQEENGSNGSSGNHGLGAQFSCTVANSGTIAGGGGGGAGGGGGYQSDKDDDDLGSGGGGGGGAGSPAGSGGAGGDSWDRNGSPGNSGSSTSGGGGGAGGDGEGEGGNGGDGGNLGSDGFDGGSGEGNNGESEGGSGGSGGSGIRKLSDVSVSTSGSITGGTSTGSVN